MNYGIIRRVVGLLLTVEAVLFIPAMLIGLSFAEASWRSLATAGLITLVVGGLFLLSSKKSTTTLRPRDGLVIVALGWFLMSFFGSLPFVLSGVIPRLIDAFFETVSGFTTTGATVIRDVESLDRGILFWRNFTQWIGGMGILAFGLALLPAMGIGSFQILKAETTGPTVSKLAPRMKNTARILYLSYLALTLVQVLLLMLSGMSWYEALLHSFSTMGTGGFSMYNDSIGSFNEVTQMVLALFMILASLNFGFFFLLYQKKWRQVWHSQELRLFAGIIGLTTLMVSYNLVTRYDFSLLRSLRDGFVQVVSMISTTALNIHDFAIWPPFSQIILLVLMFIGGCAGSTAGGMKVVRVLVAGKLVRREFSKMAHPRAYAPVRLNGRILSNESVAGITSFIALHLMVFLAGVLLISIENNLVISISSVAATLNNVGPGFGLFGPTDHYADFSDGAKVVFTTLMLLGRLELYTIVALLAPRRWLDQS